MVHGNFANGDYFIDCPSISQSALRAIFGVWINVCVAVIAFCIRYLYQSHIKRAILSHKRPQSVWYVSPAVTPTEVIELRSLLLRAVGKGRFGFVIASVFCVVAAAVGAASTVISNRAAVTNTIERDTLVQGVLATSNFIDIAYAIVAITSRIDALDKAGAPLTELFDFTPNDDETWIYEPSQWNNTWKADCKFDIKKGCRASSLPFKHEPISEPSALTRKLHPGSGGGAHRSPRSSIFRFFRGDDDSDEWYCFDYNASTVNASLVNFLVHHVGRDPVNFFVDTSIKSDVHIADCSFVNTIEGGEAVVDQAGGPAGGSVDAAANIGGVSSSPM